MVIQLIEFTTHQLDTLNSICFVFANYLMKFANKNII